MKRILQLTVIAVCLTGMLYGCSKKSSDEIDISVVSNQAVIKFENDILDFHTLTAGEKVTGSFKFKNTGKNDLVISEVASSCGCTVADYPHGAVKPGEEGMISVTYDSKDSKGMRIQKTITVVANTNPSKTVLKIVATVE